MIAFVCENVFCLPTCILSKKIMSEVEVEYEISASFVFTQQWCNLYFVSAYNITKLGFICEIIVSSLISSAIGRLRCQYLLKKSELG